MPTTLSGRRLCRAGGSVGARSSRDDRAPSAQVLAGFDAAGGRRERRRRQHDPGLARPAPAWRRASRCSTPSRPRCRRAPPSASAPTPPVPAGSSASSTPARWPTRAYLANPVDRCFFCKLDLYGAIRRHTDGADGVRAPISTISATTALASRPPRGTACAIRSWRPGSTRPTVRALAARHGPRRPGRASGLALPVQPDRDRHRRSTPPRWPWSSRRSACCARGCRKPGPCAARPPRPAGGRAGPAGAGGLDEAARAELSAAIAVLATAPRPVGFAAYSPGQRLPPCRLTSSSTATASGGSACPRPCSARTRAPAQMRSDRRCLARGDRRLL